MQRDLYEAIVEQALDAILVTDASGTIIYANRAGTRRLAQRLGSPVGRALSDVVRDLDPDTDVVRTITTLPGSLRLSVVEPASVPREPRLQLLQRAVEKATCGIVISSAEGDHPVIHANRAFLEATGYELEELRGRNLRFLQGDDRDQPARGQIAEAMRAWRPVVATVRNYRKNGNLFIQRIRIDPIEGPHGGVDYLLSIHDDVTHAEAAREQLLDGAQMMQAGRLATLGELAVGVSHEIKNPLMMMTGMLELALDGLASGDADAARSDIREALEASARITGVIDRLLEFAQKSSSEPQMLLLRDVLERTHRLVAERLRLAGIDVSLDCSEALAVRGHPESLGQAFLHLLLNTREALGEAGGWLRITAAAWNDHWIDLRFQDSGPGVPASLRERIFDPFFSTKPASSGTGLGLAVTQQVVRAHGGELAYEAHEGVGATFRVRLPRAS